jgi:hypothetical protein
MNNQVRRINQKAQMKKKKKFFEQESLSTVSREMKSLTRVC